ncbi:MAG: serine/threonine-protein kinase [Polyangiaceae bacterium]
MFVECACGASNSVFNPICSTCGAAIHEGVPHRPSSPSFIGPGAEIGGHKLESAIGSGSLGRVFRALAPDGSPRALKILHPHLIGSEDARHRFVRETRALKAIEHPSFARLFDTFDYEGLPVLVLELVEGLSLRRILDDGGPLAPDEVRAIIRELASALAVLHGAGWIHRDLKPENVVLVARAPHLRLKLLDFGLARSAAAAFDMKTKEGTFIGSLAYAAPEQIVGEEVGPAADLWALGAMAYELVTGTRPFDGARRLEIARAILAADPAELRIPDPTLARVIRDLLVREQSARPTTADLVQRLELD